MYVVLFQIAKIQACHLCEFSQADRVILWIELSHHFNRYRLPFIIQNGLPLLIGLELVRSGGRVGAITSRTCFFLSSFQKWREQVVLGMATPEVMADLGHGVMDDAMVEAAAYVLEKQG